MIWWALEVVPVQNVSRLMGDGSGVMQRDRYAVLEDFYDATDAVYRATLANVAT